MISIINVCVLEEVIDVKRNKQSFLGETWHSRNLVLLYSALVSQIQTLEFIFSPVRQKKLEGHLNWGMVQAFKIYGTYRKF